MRLKDLEGKHILSAQKILMENRDLDYIAIVLNVHNGIHLLEPEGDCCANCYITHIDGSESLLDATIKEIESLEYKQDITNGRYDCELVDTFRYLY